MRVQAHPEFLVAKKSMSYCSLDSGGLPNSGCVAAGMAVRVRLGIGTNRSASRLTDSNWNLKVSHTQQPVEECVNRRTEVSGPPTSPGTQGQAGVDFWSALSFSTACLQTVLFW